MLRFGSCFSLAPSSESTDEMVFERRDNCEALVVSKIIADDDLKLCLERTVLKADLPSSSGVDTTTRSEITPYISKLAKLISLIGTAGTSVYMVATTPGYHGHLAAQNAEFRSMVVPPTVPGSIPQSTPFEFRISKILGTETPESLGSATGFVYLPPRKPRRLPLWE